MSHCREINAALNDTDIDGLLRRSLAKPTRPPTTPYIPSLSLSPLARLSRYPTLSFLAFLRPFTHPSYRFHSFSGLYESFFLRALPFDSSTSTSNAHSSIPSFFFRDTLFRPRLGLSHSTTPIVSRLFSTSRRIPINQNPISRSIVSTRVLGGKNGEMASNFGLLRRNSCRKELAFIFSLSFSFASRSLFLPFLSFLLRGETRTPPLLRLVARSGQGKGFESPSTTTIQLLRGLLELSRPNGALYYRPPPGLRGCIRAGCV